MKITFFFLVAATLVILGICAPKKDPQHWDGLGPLGMGGIYSHSEIARYLQNERLNENLRRHPRSPDDEDGDDGDGEDGGEGENGGEESSTEDGGGEGPVVAATSPPQQPALKCYICSPGLDNHCYDLMRVRPTRCLRGDLCYTMVVRGQVTRGCMKGPCKERYECCNTTRCNNRPYYPQIATPHPQVIITSTVKSGAAPLYLNALLLVLTPFIIKLVCVF